MSTFAATQLSQSALRTLRDYDAYSCYRLVRCPADLAFTFPLGVVGRFVGSFQEVRLGLAGHQGGHADAGADAQSLAGPGDRQCIEGATYLIGYLACGGWVGSGQDHDKFIAGQACWNIGCAHDDAE